MSEHLVGLLQSVLPSAQLKEYTLQQPSLIRLWLINPVGWDRPLDQHQASTVFGAPPYWSFCWGSGQVLAEWILDNPPSVQGKTVLDFGSGSGVVAIAAAIAGAERVMACDCDSHALAAIRTNAALNGVELEYLEDFNELDESVDVLFAADVLYDPDNMELVDDFLRQAEQVILADSRVKDFSATGYQKIHQKEAVTLPDLGENEDVKQVRVYRGCSLA